MSLPIRAISVGLLAVAGAWTCWPAASSAQLEDWGVASYEMNTHDDGSGALSTGDEEQGYSTRQEYQMGLTALQAGKLHEAERDFDHAVAADRTNAPALTMRGVTFSREGDLGAAARDLAKSLKMDPTQIAALREYGVVLARQGKTDQAKAQLGFLKLQAEGCGDTCPDAATLKDAAAAVEDAIAQSGDPSHPHS